MLSTVPGVAVATPAAVSPDAGTPAGTVVLRVADLRFPGGGTVTAGSSGPSAGELAVFCRPVVTAPAAVRRDGTVLADAWLPDLVRLGELERHLGDGVIEAIVDSALAKRRLKRRQRRRIMSYPLVIRLNAPSGKEEDRLPVRVAEHSAVMPRDGGTAEVSETCTVITTLLDHQAAPADEVRETYLTRWSASETSKPQCCHSRGSSALSLVPSRSVFMKAA